ncbi:very short patch repair endonuclease [Burkholderia ubonensis]|uniref:very short patch repair endonuclease n=1 Tax=Burkholderia ubonensis TaxID=101571 RepID=UPI0007548ADD|nr:very short patch repair endonuclease [Burkholderia ubonensis]KVO95830.1 very short patch repair endonuclease [Burkholderia ubonensis]OJB27871.1 very short patch repair endonuclease [Burkholderia ubonensis]
MVDSVTPDKRSHVMSLVKGKDTQPEMIVRRIVYNEGFRYRLHDSRLPGKPDLVFNGRRKVIFVHGCFWHRHENCSLARIPKSNQEFWRIKLEGNRERDIKNIRKLIDTGWHVLVIWECELKDISSIRNKIISFLNESSTKTTE